MNFQELLDRIDHAQARAHAGEYGVGKEVEDRSSTNSHKSEDIENDGWANRSREAWSTVMYQARYLGRRYKSVVDVGANLGRKRPPDVSIFSDVLLCEDGTCSNFSGACSRS